ncbi:MAG: TonB-dependent receptor [Rhodomicrobium sp.]|nr:TonB-dependent receptor [Rhodomicrobium sp.]
MAAIFRARARKGIRDGVVPPVGEPFPTRAFPNTNYILAGLFIQDEISFGDRLKLIPALRYDHYSLTPKIDPLFVGEAAEQSDGHLSPKIGLVYWATDQFGVFANAAKGFKAPSPSQVNNGFENVIFNYRSEPNPDLRPETSATIEGGARMRDAPFLGADWAGQVTAFAGRYEDFIEQVQVGGSFTPMDPAVFQFVNLSEVRIKGVEARLEAAWENGFGAIIAASASRGDQETDGLEAPLDSIEPWKLVAGLSYRDPGGRFGGRFSVTHSAEKNDARVNQTCGGACYTPEAFTLLDLTAYLNVTEHATFRIGVFNLTDETYSWWSDARGLGASSTVLDAYTQPGRNVSASISMRL